MGRGDSGHLPCTDRRPTNLAAFLVPVLAALLLAPATGCKNKRAVKQTQPKVKVIYSPAMRARIAELKAKAKARKDGIPFLLLPHPVPVFGVKIPRRSSMLSASKRIAIYRTRLSYANLLKFYGIHHKDGFKVIRYNKRGCRLVFKDSKLPFTTLVDMGDGTRRITFIPNAPKGRKLQGKSDTARLPIGGAGKR